MTIKKGNLIVFVVGPSVKIRFGHYRCNFQNKEFGSLFFKKKISNRVVGAVSEGGLVKRPYFFCNLP